MAKIIKLASGEDLIALPCEKCHAQVYRVLGKRWICGSCGAETGEFTEEERKRIRYTLGLDQ